MPRNKKRNKQNNRPSPRAGEPINIDRSLNIRGDQPGSSTTAAADPSNAAPSLIKEEIAQKDEIITSLRSQSNSLEQEIQRWKEDYLKLREENKCIHEEKEQITNKVYEIGKEKQELQVKCKVLETHLQQKKEQSQQLEIQVEALKAGKLDLEKQLYNSSVNRNRSLGKEQPIGLEYEQKLVEDLRKESNRLKFDIENLKSENTDLTKIADKATVLAQENAQLRRENQRLKMELDELNPRKLQDPVAAQIGGSKAQK